MRDRDPELRGDGLVSTPEHILVTGGAGFIGSHVVDALVATGRRVRVLDSLHPLAHASEPSYLNPEAEYLWTDLGDPVAAANAVADIDAVCHQAAMVGLGVDLADMPAYVVDNDLATAVLLAALHHRGFSGRIVLASSMVVYGEGRYRCKRDGIVPAPPRSAERLSGGHFEPLCPHCGEALAPEAVPENAPTDPRNVYAATKLHQEHLTSAYARESGSAAIALRYHNVYGPRMPRDTPYAGVASIFRSSLEAGDAPRVFEDGGQMRDFVEVADVAAANVLALDAPAETAGAFNVASGTPRSVGELARELARSCDGPGPEVTGDFRLGDVRHVFASADRARSELGFSAETDFEAGVARFAEAELR
jgi:dTDP-L-rhamnose 4-epimerase